MPVLETYINEIHETYTVTINGESIETTPGHPFYTTDRGWVGADKLKAGDSVELSDGSSAEVESVERNEFEEPVIIYNLCVMDYHTYYVGESGVLVHNKCSVSVDDMINGDGGVGSGSVPSKFINGELYEDFIEVDGYRIEALAETEVVGDKLILKDVAIYANEGDIPNRVGVSAMKEWLNVVKEDAKSQGFKQIQISIINRVFSLE